MNISLTIDQEFSFLTMHIGKFFPWMTKRHLEHLYQLREVTRTIAVSEVKKAVDKASSADEMLSHVIKPVGVDRRHLPRLSLDSQGNSKRVEPQRTAQLAHMVVKSKQLHSFHENEHMDKRR